MSRPHLDAVRPIKNPGGRKRPLVNLDQLGFAPGGILTIPIHEYRLPGYVFGETEVEDAGQAEQGGRGGKEASAAPGGGSLVPRQPKAPGLQQAGARKDQ